MNDSPSMEVHNVTLPSISVVIPVYRGVNWLLDCLTSLAAQTLSKTEFEVILVFNGPDDGSRALAEHFHARHGALQMQLVFSDIPSAARARNMGARTQRGRFITWLDCDDWVSPEYLELLLLAQSDGVVPIAQIVNVMPDGMRDPNNLINNSILELEDHLVSPNAFPRALSFMTCKLLPAYMAREVPFDESLRSGEDVALYGAIYAQYDFRISTVPALAGAKYYRRMSEDSVSRQPPSYDFMVTQRLDVISSLNGALAHCRDEAKGLITSFINSQASFVKRFFNAHVGDRMRISEELVRRKFLYFPWNNWFDTVDRLVIAYNFLPYADTGAMVMAKRIRELGAGVDVVTHRMENVRKSVPENLYVGQPFVQRLHAVPGPAYFGSPVAIAQFVREGLGVIESWETRGRSYREVYSRCMWPASHFLAGLYKVRNPNVRWVAEFSDPVQIDSGGQGRKSPLNNDEVFVQILDAAEPASRQILESVPDVFAWTELIPYIFADELVFTNVNQLDVMLAYAPSELVSAIRSKAVVREQPTLSPAFYQLASSTYEVDPDLIHLGYFGQFYATRGLAEVMAALEGLDDIDRNRLRIHIFTSDAVSATDTVFKLGLEPWVYINDQLPYFEFLSVLHKFDCLIVNDAQTTGIHAVNPYLPSKLSDYLGSGSDIWALVEEGSVLSSLPSRYTSRIGDEAGAREVLAKIGGRREPNT